MLVIIDNKDLFCLWVGKYCFVYPSRVYWLTIILPVLQHLQRQTPTSTVTRSSRLSPTIRTHGAWQADTNCGSLGDQNHVGQKLTGSPLWVVWMVSYIIGTGSVHEGQQGLEYIMRWCGQAGLGVLLRGPDAHLLTSP